MAEGNEYIFKVALAVLKVRLSSVDFDWKLRITHICQLFHDDLLPLPFEHIIAYLKQKQNRLTVPPSFLIKLADAYSRSVDKPTLDALAVRYNSPKKSIFRLETV